MRLRLSDVTGLLDTWYDPAWAEAWDAVGLVCGDPDADVRRVLLAVDPAPPVADEARRVGRRPAGRATTRCSSAPCTASPRPTPKGRTLHALLRRRRARCSPRTPTPTCRPAGSPSRWPRALGLARPARSWSARRRPRSTSSSSSSRSTHADAVRAALAAAGAGAIGDYDSASFIDAGGGPVPAAGRAPPQRSARSASSRWSTRSGSRRCCRAPAAGRRGRARCWPPTPTRSRRTTSSSSPTPAPADARRRPHRHGRAPTTLRGFAEQVAAALPATAHGVRVAGDPDRRSRRVAVCGGRGRLPARHRAAHATPTST